MRVKLYDRIDIGTPKNATYYDPKKLSFKEQISTSLRLLWFHRKKAIKQQELLESKEIQARMECIENLKTVVLAQIARSMSPDTNKALQRTKRKAIAVTIAIDRQFNEVVDEMLTHKEFEGYVVTRYKENKDAVYACPQLPILIRFRKNTV